jgi:hypothetical protein
MISLRAWIQERRYRAVVSVAPRTMWKPGRLATEIELGVSGARYGPELRQGCE